MLKKLKNRIEWVDTLKFLGIFAIYLGHFGKTVGKIFPFVFLYHIPLFFLISGFFARSTDKPFLRYCKDKAILLILPYFFFSLVAIIYFSIIKHWDFSQIIDTAKWFLIGTRTRIYAETLWFFPCLFIIEVVHYALLKFTKNIYIPLGISVVLFIITQTLLQNNPIQKPSWFMNFDSAMYYYVFYAIGSVVFPLVNRKFISLSNFQKVLRAVFIIFSIFFVIISYVMGGGWLIGKIINFFPALIEFNSKIYLFSLLPTALIIIYFNFFLAKLISRVGIFKKIGRETLIFCGTEKVFKDFFLKFMTLFGWDRSFPFPLLTIIYCFGCLVVSYYTIVLILNKYFPVLIGRWPSREKLNLI